MVLENARSRSLSYRVVFWKYLDILVKDEDSSSFFSFIRVLCKSFPIKLIAFSLYFSPCYSFSIEYRRKV